jgi:hypothetical protein
MAAGAVSPGTALIQAVIATGLENTHHYGVQTNLGYMMDPQMQHHLPLASARTDKATQ